MRIYGCVAANKEEFDTVLRNDFHSCAVVLLNSTDVDLIDDMKARLQWFRHYFSFLL